MLLSKLCMLVSNTFSSWREPAPAASSHSYSYPPKSRHRRAIISSKHFLMSLIRCHRITKKLVIQSAIITAILTLILFFIIYAIVVCNFSRETTTEWSHDPRSSKFRWSPHHPGSQQEGSAIAQLSEDQYAYWQHAPPKGSVADSAQWNSNKLFEKYSHIPQCNRNAKLLILITSAPENHKQRREIRQTWCSASSPHVGSFQCVFLLGQTNNAMLNANISKEITTHQDILQGLFLDSYRNLTSKVLLGLTWSAYQCAVPYVLKTDDDCFVNTNLFMRLLEVNPPSPHVSLYMGRVFYESFHLEVIRDTHNKWAVSWSQYFPSHYPPYASGAGYFLTQTLVQDILQESQNVQLFPVEDAYIGVVVKNLGIRPTDSARFTHYNIQWTVCNFLYLLVIHRVGASQQANLMKQVIEAPELCKELEFITSWD